MKTFSELLKWLSEGDQEHVLDTRVLAEYDRLWKYVGLWPHTTNNGGGLCYYYPRMVISLAAFSLVICAIDLCVNWGNMVACTELVSLLTVSLLSIVKTSTYIYQLDKMKKIILTLEKLYQRQPSQDKYVRKVLWRVQLFSKVVSTYAPIPLIVVMSGFGFGMFVMAIISRTVPFRGLFPCNTSASPCLELALIFQLTFSGSSVHTIGMGDAFLVDIYFQIWMQFKILSFNLKSLRTFAVNQVQEEARGKLASKASVVVILARWPARLNRPPTNHKTTRDTGVNEPRRLEGNDSQTFRRVSVDSTRQNEDLESNVLENRAAKEVFKLKINRAMEIRLKECVDDHQTLLRLANDLNSFFNPYLMVQVLCNLIVISTSATYLSLVSTLSAKELVIFAIIFLLFVELFFFSWISSEVEHESLDVKEAIYACDWTEMSETFKRSMRIIISRSNDPVVFRIAGFVPLSLDLFRDVSHKAFSYFMVMRTVAEKNTVTKQ